MNVLAHGTRTRYQKGCRCEPCLEVNRTYMRNWMAAWRAAHPVVDEVDEVAVQRALSGDRVALNRAEMAEAFQRLNSRGLSAARIANQMGVAERTVVRWRSRRTLLPRGRAA